MTVMTTLMLLMMCYQEVAVQVQQLQSPAPVSGVWQEIDANHLVLRAGQSEQSLAISGLRTVRFAGQPNAMTSELEVRLLDGSVARPIDVTAKQQDVILKFDELTNFNIPAKAISSVRFQKLNDVQAAQWQSIIDSRISGDTLVVIRSAESLDKIEGLVTDISEQQVGFEFSQQKISAPRAKLAGLKLFNPAVGFGRAFAVVHDRWGNVWQAAGLQSADAEHVTMVTVGGTELQLKLSQLSAIDFSIGSVQYVAELEPIGSQRDSLFSLQTSISEGSSYFAPATIQLPQTQGPSLQMAGAGVVTYRVPADYRRLAGEVVLSPEGEQFTPCTVQVKLESQVLWEAMLAKPAAAVTFDVAVEPEQRLQLVVKPDAKYVVGDRVVWREIRLLK